MRLEVTVLEQVILGDLEQSGKNRFDEKDKTVTFLSTRPFPDGLLLPSPPWTKTELIADADVAKYPPPPPPPCPSLGSERRPFPPLSFHVNCSVLSPDLLLQRIIAVPPPPPFDVSQKDEFLRHFTYLQVLLQCSQGEPFQKFLED